MFNRLSLLGKINIIVALVFLIVTSIETLISVQDEKSRYLKNSEEQVRELTRWYFDSLNTMMLTGTMNQRGLLQQKLLSREQVLEARVIRGEPVSQQFGGGFPDEQVMDEHDRLALTGKAAVVFSEGEHGRELTIITPFRATENTRGVNCLHCHDVPSGAVNGAIRVKYSLNQLDDQINNDVVKKILTNSILFAIGLVLVNIMLIRWFTRPMNQLMETVHMRAAGNSSVRANITTQDEIGRLGKAFNNMADNVNASTQREHKSNIDLQQKVDDLCAVMRRVTDGDFNIQVGFSGDGAIGELASSLQIMIEKLRLAIEEKQVAVEILKRKVDRILLVTDYVTDGDLTRSINIKGDDAIAQLSEGVEDMISSLNGLVAEIQQSGENVKSSTDELSNCMSQVQTTAEHQAMTTGNIAETATEMSSKIDNLMNSMGGVAMRAEAANGSAIQCSADLQKLQKNMETVIVSAENVSEKLVILDERARNISAVVTTIAKIADQTNLLSLNAAVEAEKAGEYGRGFAVVATEIRRLADQTAISTLDIEQMVSEMQHSVSSGVDTMQSFTEQVKESVAEVQMVSKEQTEIISHVEIIGPQFDQLHQSMQFQANSSKEIQRAMQLLNNEATSTVASVRLSSSTINILSDAAISLTDSVSRFKVKKSDASLLKK